MRLSDYGKRLTQDAGILQLMDDLGKALADHKPVAMLGGGTPAQIPEATAYFKSQLLKILDDEALTKNLLGNYDTPQGNSRFIVSFVNYLNRHFDWHLTPDNVVVTPGSQAGFFMLFNLLTGTSQGGKLQALLPITPEYIGYVDQMIEPNGFKAIKPLIKKIGQREFKYTIDFDNIVIDDSIATIALSRPTNPTGNTVTNSELKKLAVLAKKHQVPLVIDNAYGLPFPGVIDKKAKPYFDDNTVLSFSLSKLGLPSSRTGIMIGPAKPMQAIASANAILNLASPSYGEYITEGLFANDEIDKICQRHIQPFYAERATFARSIFMKTLPKDLPWRFHVYEGSYFFWLWLDGAKKSSKEIYEFLKDRGVITVPGEYFFPGMENTDWQHKHECLRLNFSRPDSELRAGAKMLAEAISWAY